MWCSYMEGLSFLSVLPVSVTIPTETLWIAGPLSRLLWSGWGLGGTGWTGQIQNRRAVVALLLLLLALPGVVFNYHLLCIKHTRSDIKHRRKPHDISVNTRFPFNLLIGIPYADVLRQSDHSLAAFDTRGWGLLAWRQSLLWRGSIETLWGNWGMNQADEDTLKTHTNIYTMHSNLRHSF